MAEQPTPLEEEPPPSEEVKKSEDTLIIVETERLTLGLFICTMFISMWITNAAATAMMTPIIRAIIETLEKEGMCVLFKQVADPNDPGSTTKPSRTTLGYFLGVAYAATIGGVSTYVGTGTNLAARDYLERSPNFVPGWADVLLNTFYINETKALIRSNKNLTNITAEKMKD
ncbi:hypothetical protein C0J52_05367 [Blattella germanica]|nr:hypothetical protein C0J52_05367 [Blattella germanica]